MTFIRNTFAIGLHLSAQSFLFQRRMNEALHEFQLAAAIDVSSGIAQQEIERTQRTIEKAQRPAAAPPISRAPRGNLSESASNVAGPAQLAASSQTPLTLKLAQDSKTIYETIGKLEGINVLFDPDYVSRPINIELDRV